ELVFPTSAPSRNRVTVTLGLAVPLKVSEVWLVMLSSSEAPESDPEARSGAEGAASSGGVRNRVTVEPAGACSPTGGSVRATVLGSLQSGFCSVWLEVFTLRPGAGGRPPRPPWGCTGRWAP